MATKEGEFLSKRVQKQKKGEFGRNWKLIEDHKDPRKRLWHLIETNNGKERIVKKRIGAINIGGNIGTTIERTWKKGQENEKRFQLQLKERIAQKKAEGYVYDYGKWVPGPDFEKIQTQLKASKIAENNAKTEADREEAFIEEEAHEWGGEQPDAQTQIDLANMANRKSKTKESGSGEQASFNETWNSDEDVDTNRVWDDSGEMMDKSKPSDNVGPRERLTARERMRAQNVERFGGGEVGEKHVRDLEQRNTDFQAMKRGEMTKAEFRELNPNSQTAKAWRKKQLKNRKKVKIKK